MKAASLLALLLLPALLLRAQQTAVHTTAASNCSANSSYLDLPALNGNPSAVITIEADAAARNANPHAIGVWYDGSRWAIFNQDRAAMPAGVSYKVRWENSGKNAFVAKSTGGPALLLSHPALDNNPQAAFYLSQVWNPGGTGGVYNNADVAVGYDKSSGKWNIRNANGSELPAGAAFNILFAGAQAANRPVINRNGADIVSVQPNVLTVVARDGNLGFENGLFKWTATGNAFANQPVSGNTVISDRVLTGMQYTAGGIGGDYWKSMVYPIGIKGTEWIGTYENGNGDAPTGTLTSAPLKTERRYLHFLMGGGKDINNIYVELQVKLEDYQAAWGAGKRGLWGMTDDGYTRVDRLTPLVNSEELYRYWFDLDAELNHQWQNKTVRVCIVDNSSRGWGHINVDDIGMSESVSDFLAVNRGGFTLYADKDKPVWGFADTHAHWVNHVGLNGLMHGTPGYKLETSDVRRDVPPCDGYNHGLPSLTPGMLIAQTEKAAWNRIPERLADPGNSLCIASVLATGIAFWPSGVATLGGAGAGALFGSIGQAASGAQAATGALDGTITGAVWGLATNPAFQACGYLFTKDVLARHYGNYTPANRPEISNYVDFPRWNSFFHQMMHISWVRRSYDGGQRLMVVPVGTAKSWEFNTTADGRMASARKLVEDAVTELKKIVNENNGWMGIARTPAEARSLILSNKMAVVIALEQAEVGSYFESALQEVRWLDSLGIRHVFPIHNIDNKLGGAAVFNSTLNSYNDLVNRSSNDGYIKAFNVREGNSGDDTRTNIKLDRNFMRQNLRTFPIAGFGTIPFFYSNDVPADYQYGNFVSHKNAQGLTDKGLDYMNELMKKGMIIDVDHMSDLAQNRAMQLMERFQYPMISGHSNFRELRRESSETGGSDKEARLKTEFTIFDSRASEINNDGGMFGIMTQQNNIRSAPGCPVENKSPGGSSSFAQAYWYILQKTGGDKGIAFGTDFNGFAPQVAPRFGVDAGFMMEGDNVQNRKVDNTQGMYPADDFKDAYDAGSATWVDNYPPRRDLAFQQRNGVRYDVPVKTYHYHRFLKPPFLTSEEREIWEAIAIAKSGVDPAQAWQPGGGLSVERTGLQQDKINNMAQGFRWGILREPTGDYGAFLECPGYVVRDENLNNCMPERKAAYMAVRGENSLPDHMKTTRTRELYRVMKRVYDLWMQFENGPNEPMRRSFAYTGGRDFDFNIDGLAHYGLLPDLIQDLKNQGLNSGQLRPLFLATEQYLLLWERSVQAAARVQ